MVQSDFNRELSSYLKERTRSSTHSDEGFFGKQKVKESSGEEVPQMNGNEVVIIKGKKGIVEKIIDRIHRMRKKDRSKIEVEEQVAPVEGMYGEKEFEKEEMEYDEELEKTKQGFWAKIVSFFVSDRQVSEEEIIDEQAREEKEAFKEELHGLEKEEEKLDKNEMKIKEKKLNLIFNFLQKFRFAGKSAEEDLVKEEAKEFDLYQDLKEVSKITTDVMKRLPYEQLEILKKTDNFKRFKEILAKHRLIKDEPKPDVDTTEIIQEPPQTESMSVREKVENDLGPEQKVEVVDMPKATPVHPQEQKKEEINIYRLDELYKE